jgi:uncharacterized protein (DUF849 family)
MTPLDHPALPTTAAALAETARACRRAGAAMIHLHVRDRAGLHVLDPDLYREAIAAVKNATANEMVIQITTESVGRYAPSRQMAVVRAVRPSAVSLAAREFCLDAASVEAFAAFVAETVEAGAAVQVIIYDAGELARFEALAGSGLFDLAALSLLYVCGVYGGRAACVADVTGLLPRRAEWRDVMVCAFGAAETAVVAAAARLGADVRIGFENNLRLPGGELAPDNAALVAATVRALEGEDLALGDGEALARRWGLR